MREISDVSSKYGSPMGRPNKIFITDEEIEFDIQRLDWVDGDYDQGGAYWGYTDNDYIYWFVGESSEHIEEIFIRAKNIEDAKKELKKTYAKATFTTTSLVTEFAAGYLEAIKFYQIPSDEKYEDCQHLDIAPEVVETVEKICENFLNENKEMIIASLNEKYDISRAGIDLYLTQSETGSGFIDRDIEYAKELHDAAKNLKQLYLYDDGEKITLELPFDSTNKM